MAWQDFKILSEADIQAFKHTGKLESAHQLGERVALNLITDLAGKSCCVQVCGIVCGVTYGPMGMVHYDIAFPIAPGFYARVPGLRGAITKPGEHLEPGSDLVLVDDVQAFLGNVSPIEKNHLQLVQSAVDSVSPEER